MREGLAGLLGVAGGSRLGGRIPDSYLSATTNGAPIADCDAPWTGSAGSRITSPGSSPQQREVVAGGLLSRDALVQLLERDLAKRVTMLSAPPGSGKTSLLRAWAARSANTRRVAFVSVDRDEQNPERFWVAVLEAIRRAGTSTDREVQTPAPALDDNEVVERVLSEVYECGESVVLIIDDLHELGSPDAIRQLEHLLTRLPSSARVVLSSRRDPLMRLHQLRLADELAEIRSDHLRFTEHETRELLTISGIGLSAAGVSALYRRTEGWAAGLRLAVVSLVSHPDPERFVAHFSGIDRAIGEYLMAEMLERQSSEAQGMLLRTSIVDRMNGELADLLAGRPGSEQILLELEDANAFVVSLDSQRTWFRYHQLLGDFLRLELRRKFADEIPDLHRQAARWFAEQGDSVQAVRHLLGAGDWPAAARLLADHSLSLTLDGEERTIGALLRSFPGDASFAHPDLVLAVAATRLAEGRLEEAAAQLALAESHVASAPPERRRRLAVAIASLRLALARRSGHLTEVIEQANLLDASIAADSGEAVAMGSELRGITLMNLGIVETWSGRFADAQRHLSEGAALAQMIGRPYLEVVCRAHQGFPSKLVSVEGARRRGLEAVALAEHYGLDDRPILAPALGAVSGMAMWTGEFDEGERSLRRAWRVAEAGVDPATALLLHLVTGMLHIGRGQHQSAITAFASAAEANDVITGMHAHGSRVAGWLAATQARVGMLDEARATLTKFAAPERIGVIANARAVICMAEGDHAGALDVIRDGQDLTPPSGPAFTMVEAHLLAGTAHLRLGDRGAAAAEVEAALTAAEPDRLIFPFALTEAAELLGMLPHHQTAHGALLTDIVDVLAGASASRTSREPVSLPEALSPSEVRVLRYLPTNMVRAEIARELYVSVNTVNTHLRNIYSKLGVGNRSAAVRRARELSLLAAGSARRFSD